MMWDAHPPGGRTGLKLPSKMPHLKDMVKEGIQKREKDYPEGVAEEIARLKHPRVEC